MSTLADAMLELDIDDLKDRYKSNDVFVSGGDIGDVMEGKGMVSSSTSEYIPIFSTVDGTVSMVSAKQAALKCRRKKDGTRDFVLSRPEKYEYVFDPAINGLRKVTKGLKCHLHPDHPNRAEYDEMGLAGQVCRKANIPSEFQLQRHMATRHQNEWKTIEDHMERIRRDEDRAMQRQMLEALSRRGPGRPPKED